MPVELLHLTDLHLFSDPAQTLQGVPTREAFQEVLSYIDRGARAGKWDFAKVVITGDLAHDESRMTYEVLRDLLGGWTSRCWLIPGNHDDRMSIREVFPELVPPCSGYANFSGELAGWRFVGLDSQCPGEVAGRIEDDQLEWLAAELDLYSAQPTIVFVHHPPFLIHSAWLDELGLLNAPALMERIRGAPQVRVVCAGHVHQEYQEHRHGIDLLTTPSTAVQFRPRDATPGYDRVPPGFRIFRLDGDRCESRVIRLPELKFAPTSRE